MPNYTIKTKAWQPLTDIMGDDYETTRAYNVHVNRIGNGCLQYMKQTPDPEGKTPTPDDSIRGAEYPAFSDIPVAADTGDHVYLKASDAPISVSVETTGA